MNSASMTPLRALAGVALTGLCVVAVAGCGGDDVPSDAVARVGDTVITKQDFDHWYASAAASQQQAGGPAVPPDPPSFTKCVAALKSAQPKGAATQSDDALKKQCKQSYDQLKQQVMQFLIQSQWVLQESADQDVKVSDTEVRRLFEDQKKQAFPKAADYKKFLRTSGSTEGDILFRIKLDALQNKLTQKIQKDQGKITDEDIEKYYDENKAKFAQPERRDLNVVLTKTKAQADDAKQQLDDGESFKTVSQELSIDQASKANGGKLPDVAQGQQEKTFDDAVFKAEKGKIEGPVKTQFGWYVYEVTAIKPSKQQSLDEAKQSIRTLLQSQGQQKALQDFIEDFREEFKDQTKCRDGYVIAECSNAPDDQTETGPASGGAPAPQQGAPQGAAPPTQGAPQGAPTPAPAP
jgi:foldase protein PrsA